MHATENFKTVHAQRTKVINSFKKAKHKLLNTNAATQFNKICRKFT